jgi:hypothetical protein
MVSKEGSWFGCSSMEIQFVEPLVGDLARDPALEGPGEATVGAHPFLAAGKIFVL